MTTAPILKRTFKLTDIHTRFSASTSQWQVNNTENFLHQFAIDVVIPMYAAQPQTKYSMEVIDVLVVGFHQPESSWWIGTRLSLGTKFRLARVTWTSFDVV
jgi:hypothetical protein